MCFRRRTRACTTRPRGAHSGSARATCSRANCGPRPRAARSGGDGTERYADGGAESYGAPVFRNGKLPWPSSTFLFGYGIAERLGTVDDDYKPTQPMLSTGWEMAEDQSEVIVNLRDDVEFHQGWGKMTADDVVYSYNDANVTTNPESRWDDAGEISVVYKNAEAIDDQTVRLVVQEFQAVRGQTTSHEARW